MTPFVLSFATVVFMWHLLSHMNFVKYFKQSVSSEKSLINWIVYYAIVQVISTISGHFLFTSIITRNTLLRNRPTKFTTPFPLVQHDGRWRFLLHLTTSANFHRCLYIDVNVRSLLLLVTIFIFTKPEWLASNKSSTDYRNCTRMTTLMFHIKPLWIGISLCLA